MPTVDASASFWPPVTSTSSGDGLDHRGFVVALVGKLIDGEHAHVLEHDIGHRVVLFALPRQQHIDAVAGQHETGDTLDVIDADGDRLHAVIDHRRQRGALARTGDLAGKDRLVDVDRR